MLHHSRENTGIVEAQALQDLSDDQLAQVTGGGDYNNCGGWQRHDKWNQHDGWECHDRWEHKHHGRKHWSCWHKDNWCW